MYGRDIHGVELNGLRPWLENREAFRMARELEKPLPELDGHHDRPRKAWWRSWSDRVFYLCDDGIVRSMTRLFSNHTPAPVQLFVAGVNLIRCRSIRQTFRVAFPCRQELAL